MFFGSLFARGYQEAGRRQSTGCVMEREGKAEKGRSADRWGPCKKKEELTARETDKQAELREEALPVCAHKQQERFVTSFCLHVYPPPLSLLPSPNRFSHPLALSSLLAFCPLPALHVFILSLPSLAHLSSTLCLGAITANQTVYPSLISALPHGAPAPAKQ